MTILIKRCCEGGFWQAMQRKKKGGREAVAGANNSFQNQVVLSLCRGSSATNNHPPSTWVGQNRTAIPTEKITQPYLLLNLPNLEERYHNTSVFYYTIGPWPHAKYALKRADFLSLEVYKGFVMTGPGDSGPLAIFLPVSPGDGIQRGVKSWLGV